jgi:hypothetical protein
LLKRRSPIEIGLVLIVIFVFILVLYGNDKAAYATHMSVTVTINRIANLHSGYVNYCIDPVFLGCDRADFYGKISFQDKNGKLVFCDTTNVIKNLDFPSPGWTCTINGVSQSPTMESPVKLILEIWDDDRDTLGCSVNSPPGACDYQVDISDAGPGKAFTMPIRNGTSTITTPGTFHTVDALVVMTVTGRLLPHAPPPSSAPPGTSAPKPPLSNIYVEYSPMVPVSGSFGTLVSDLIDFKATPLDSKNNRRLTDTVEIWVANNNDLLSHKAPTTPAKTCSRVSICELLDVRNLTDTAGRFAYKAVAYDTTGGKVETSWRMVTVPRVGDLTLNLITTPLMAGVNSDPFKPPLVPGTGIFADFDLSKAVDMVFFPGTGYSLSMPDQREKFSLVVLNNIRYFFNPPGNLSTVLDHQNNVNFWISPRTVQVLASQPDKPSSPDNLCNAGAVDKPTFSAINAILHNVNCRDQSSGGAPGDLLVSTGKHPEITWHEFHHAAYGLSDEYYTVFLDANGERIVWEAGYHSSYPYPNVFRSSTECAADPLSNGNCRVLRSSNSVESNNYWWRFDPNPDVMDENTVERASDIRRSSWLYEQCERGYC